MRTQHIPGILLGILSGIGVALAQQIAPADYLAMTLAQDQMLADGVVGPILDHPWLTDGDKELMRKTLQPMNEALAAMKNNAAANPTIEGIQADQAKVVQSTQDIILALKARQDLAWIADHGRSLGEMKGRMLQDKSAAYVALIKAAGADDAQMAKIKAMMDQFKADLAEMSKQAAIFAQTGDQIGRMTQQATFTQKTRATLKAIDALLTLDQRFELEWSVVKAMTDNDISTYRILGYAAQPGMVRVPEAGTYLLREYQAPPLASDAAQPKPPTTGRGGGGARGGTGITVEPKQLATVTLKKGDPIGFKKTDQGTTATAGDKTFAVPAESVTGVYWEFSPAKP